MVHLVGLVGGGIVFGSLATGVASLGLVWYLARHRGTAGATWFMGSLAAQALWTLSYGAGLVVFDPFWRGYAEALAWTGMNFVGPLFLGFALEYTGRTVPARTRWLPVLFVSPVVTTLLALTHPWHTLLWRAFRLAPVFDLATASYAIQPLGYATVITSLSMAGVGVLLLVETVLSYGPLYRRETVAVVLSPVPATLPLLVWLSGLGPVPALNLTPLLLLSHVALDAYAFSGTHMFETNPATQRAAERSALDDLDDPLLVVDTGGRVVNLNERAKELFDAGRQGLPVPIADLTGASVDELRTAGEFEADPPSGDVYAVSYTPLTGPEGDALGGIVVLYDITEQRRREQQLSVLNRVMRHNLRNELTVVRGHAESIRSRVSDPTLADESGTIISAGDRLLSIAEEVQAFERVQKQGVEPTTVDVADSMASVREAAVEAADATVEVTVERAVDRVRTDPDVLGLALDNLVENAVVHGDGGVWIRAFECPDGGTAFEVRDDNEAIPDEELAALERGEETPLQHGQGIGLWVVNWCVTALDGELSFRYDGGNVVTIRLSPADGDETEPDRSAVVPPGQVDAG